MLLKSKILKKIMIPARLSQKKPTLGSMFKKSLGELMAIINSTNVHYIRCIKPNSEKSHGSSII